MKEVKEHYDNRQLRRHYWVNEKGKLGGEYKSWYENGQLVIHSFYKNGLLDSEYKGWHENGQIWEHCFYKNGEFNGEYKSWHHNGQSKEHYFFHNDKKVDISDYVTDVNNITEQEYFHLKMTFGYFPIIKYNGKL